MLSIIRALTIALLGLNGLVAQTWAQAPVRSALVLDQSTRNAPWSVALQSRLEATLNSGPGAPVSVHFENLDFGLFGGAQYEENLRGYLSVKYRNVRFGVIIALGGRTLEFAIQSRSQLWPDVPIVFAGVDETDIAVAKGVPAVTGTVMRLPLADLVAAARVVDPNFARLAIVGDRFENQLFRCHYRQEVAELASKINIIDLTGLPMDVLKTRVAALGDDTVIAYTNIYSDGKGLAYTPRQALTILAGVANRPIVIDVETFFGAGGVGGFLVRPAPIAEDAGWIALRILNGEGASNIPVSVGSFKKPIFDWRQLQKWQVDPTRLPSGSEVQFRPLTAWEQYSSQIVLVALALAGQTVAILILIYERRRRRQAEAEMALRMADLARANRTAAVGALSASIAHELTQPLSAIIINAGAGMSLLDRKSPDLKEAATVFNEIVNDGYRASDVIKTVRAMFAQGTQEKARLDFNELVREVLRLLHAEIISNRVAIKSELGDGLPSVRGDRTQLQQIILNLTMNAIEAMQPVSERPRVLQLVSEAREGAIVFTIRDSGLGVAPENLDKIFDTYFTTKPGGMGMGLSICRSIAEAHGGHLSAVSIEPHGMAFELRLPASDG